MSVDSHGGQNTLASTVATEAVYTRPMPGGGYVRAELLVSEPAGLGRERLRGRVVVERRSYAPPSADELELVVEEVEGSDPDAVVAELVRIARDNAAIARRILRHSTSHPRAN